jgi:lysophospholipid acyltransferase (LPLAT)-like uncharacterized protein
MLAKFKLMLISTVAYWIATLWFSTIKIEWMHPDIYQDCLIKKTRGNMVVGAWHRHAFFLVWVLRKVDNGGVMISRSKDGDYTAAFVSKLGFTAVRGSSSRGGKAALDAMVSYLSDTKEGGRFCGTAVDGPRGPGRVLKNGMLVLAMKSGAQFLPVACSCNRAMTLSKSWDRMMIPLPFSKVVVDFLEPVKIPSGLPEHEFESLRLNLETRMNQQTDRLDAITGYGLQKTT